MDGGNQKLTRRQMKQIKFYLEPDVLKALETTYKSKGISRQELIEGWIFDYIRKDEKDE